MIQLNGLSAEDGRQLLEHWKCGIDSNNPFRPKLKTQREKVKKRESKLLTDALIERASGHPIALRNIAAAVLSRTEDAGDIEQNSAALEAFLADPAAGQLSNINNSERLAIKIIRRRFDQLKEEERSKFLKLALRTRSFETAIISDLGINRKLRFFISQLRLATANAEPRQSDVPHSPTGSQSTATSRPV